MKQIDIVDDIYEDALKIAKERNESVQAVIEEILREKIGKKPNPQSIIGIFADEPEMVDEMMNAVYELRKRPLRIPHD